MMQSADKPMEHLKVHIFAALSNYVNSVRLIHITQQYLSLLFWADYIARAYAANVVARSTASERNFKKAFPIATKFGAMTMTSSTKVASSSSDRNGWRWGFTPQAESWNGRLAMVGFLSAVLIEAFSSQGVLHFWNLM